MTHHASRLSTARLAGVVALTAAGGAAALAPGAVAQADSTVSPPTLVVSFTPPEIGILDGSSSITYTITNPNSSGSLYNIGFSDQLPGNAVFDDPATLTVSGCGTPTDTPTAGAGEYGATGITVKAGTPCTISVPVTPTAVGNESDTLGALTYTTAASGAVIGAPSANETSASLDVLAAPTIVVSIPRKNAVYTYGEKVKARYVCDAPSDANGSTLGSCQAFDDLGNEIDDGAYLDTTAPGQHDLQVSATDNDGDSVNTQVNYTVLADNIITVRKAKAGAKGATNLTLAVPGAGTLAITEVHGSVTVASKTVKVAVAKRFLSVSLSPAAAGAQALAAAGDKLAVTLKIAYSPKGGHKRAIEKTLTLS